jgi:histidine triad (HIT) family protein
VIDMDCIFCKIANGDIPAAKVYEDEKVIAFNDISPVAPIHILIIPKVHISSAMDLDKSNTDLVGHIFFAAQKIAEEMNIAQSGFRIVNNCGKDGGQTVDHIHFHLIGGRGMKWPPG